MLGVAILKKKIVRIFVLLLVILLWAYFLLFQHIACIAAVCGEQPWYLYALAILPAGL